MSNVIEFEYLVSYGGGHGDRVWDSEMTVLGVDIRAALETAWREISENMDSHDWTIFAIEQKD